MKTLDKWSSFFLFGSYSYWTAIFQVWAFSMSDILNAGVAPRHGWPDISGKLIIFIFCIEALDKWASFLQYTVRFRYNFETPAYIYLSISLFRPQEFAPIGSVFIYLPTAFLFRNRVQYQGVEIKWKTTQEIKTDPIQFAMDLALAKCY